MEIVDRKENSLLSRIEIRFQLRHEQSATPSRSNLRSKVASLEPGSSASNVIVKDVTTRFGQPLTTGLAFIYDSPEAMQIEPQYILDRHGVATENAPAEKAPAEKAPAEKAPAKVPDVAPPAEIETEEDVSGGEE
jgi:small subunit ribosomal protein S24e